LEKGTILFHVKFEFKNGNIGEKLIVLLNDPKPSIEPYLFCKTTSRQKGKLTIPGCQSKWSLFYIPGKQDFFELGTWLQLHEIFEGEAKSFLKDHFDGHLQIKGKLKDTTITSLMKCIKIIDDISDKHKEMILKKK